MFFLPAREGYLRKHVSQVSSVTDYCSQFMVYAKVMQTESKTSSLLECSTEVQLILCKGNANREQRCKLACNLCRGAAYLMQR